MDMNRRPSVALRVLRAFPRVLAILTPALTASAVVATVLSTVGSPLDGKAGWWWLALVLPVFATTFLLVGLVLRGGTLGSQLPIPWNIGIVGFPQSGKTTLIVSLFGEMFARRLNCPVVPQGTSTIERVNEGLRALKEGRSLGPTQAQDRFSFRADITVGEFPHKRTYKVEFGDFPGDDSQRYSDEHGEWFHNTEFFKWVEEADAIVFAIDLGKYVQDPGGYAHLMLSAVRAAWQEFVAANQHRLRTIRKMPLVLAFTKADVLAYVAQRRLGEEACESATHLAFGAPPGERVLASEDVDTWMAPVLRDFYDLVVYLAGESSRFWVLPTSSFGRDDDDGVLFGFHRLMKAVLPR